MISSTYAKMLLMANIHLHAHNKVHLHDHLDIIAWSKKLQVTQKYTLKSMFVATMVPSTIVTIWQTGAAKRSLFYTCQQQTNSNVIICYHH